MGSNNHIKFAHSRSLGRRYRGAPYVKRYKPSVLVGGMEMDNKKIKRREEIEIEYQGDTYIGKRIIKGARKLDQYIVYNDKCLADLKGYKPEQIDGLMLAISKTMLTELVSGRTMSAQPASKYKL